MSANAGGLGGPSSSYWIGSAGTPWYFALLVILAVLVVLAAGLRLGLSRPRSTSFTQVVWVIAAPFAALWLIVTLLLIRIHVSADVAELGASVGASISLAGWVFVLMAGWGVAVEVIASFATPWLVGRGNTWLLTLPATTIHASWVTDSSGAPIAADPSLGSGAPLAPQPLTAPLPVATTGSTTVPMVRRPPVARRTKVLAGFVVGAVLTVIVAAVVAVQVLNHTRYTADRPVKAYLDALSRGQVDEALSLAGVSDELARGPLLDARVLATERPTQVRVVSTRTAGHVSHVTVTYVVAGTPVRQTFNVLRQGHTNVLFARWALAPVPLSDVEIDTSDIATLTVNGVPLTPNGDGQLLSSALPGSYAVQGGDPSGWITAEPQTLEVGPGATDTGQTVELTGEPSQKLLDEVNQRVEDYVRACARQHTTSPKHCSFSYWDSSVTSPRWTVTSLPAVELSEGDDPSSWTFDTQDSGRVRFTGVEHFFGTTKVNDDEDVYVSGDVSIQGHRSRSPSRTAGSEADAAPVRWEQLGPEQGGGRVLEDSGDVGEERDAELAVDQPVVEGQGQRVTLRGRRSRPRAPTAAAAPRRSARIAASPGLRIGVPVSTPKTPTLVMVIVPPAMSAGWVRPSRAVAVEPASAWASSSSDIAVGVLDVRDDQPARGRRGDAEVDVVLDHDLLVGLVPRRR